MDEGGIMHPVEIKSAQTFRPDFFKNLNYFNALAQNDAKHSHLIYGGTQNMLTDNGHIRSWDNLPDFAE